MSWLQRRRVRDAEEIIKQHLSIPFALHYYPQEVREDDGVSLQVQIEESEDRPGFDRVYVTITFTGWGAIPLAIASSRKHLLLVQGGERIQHDTLTRQDRSRTTLHAVLFARTGDEYFWIAYDPRTEDVEAYI